MATAPAALAGVRKAAILLVLIGEEAASQVFKNLPERDLQDLTQEIAEVDYIDPSTALMVLQEYHRLTVTQNSYVAVGGTDYAKKLLIRSFGEDGARQLLSQISVAVEKSATKLGSLRKAGPQQLAKFLEVEHPQTIALILLISIPKQASVLLLKLPEAMRAETIKRMAQLRQFSPEIAQRISMSLHMRLQSMGEQHRRAYAGLQGVADLLNRLDPVSIKQILETIEADDANIALGIRNLMFTFQDLMSVPDVGIREILGQLDKKTLSVALRGASEYSALTFSSACRHAPPTC